VLDKCKGYIDGAARRPGEEGQDRRAKANYLKTLVTYTLEDSAFKGCDFVLEAVFES